MNLKKFFQFIIFVTVLSLVYIHIQMKIIDLAYQGKTKENKIRELIEANGNTTYAILKIKSSQNIGGKMLSENSKMNFIDPNNIVKLSASTEYLQDDSVTQYAQGEKSSRLLSLLSFGTRAEAGSR